MTDRFQSDPARPGEADTAPPPASEVRLMRPPSSASRFVVKAAAALRPRAPSPCRALDVAMGSGRHALPLARMGWRLFGVDADFDAIVRVSRQAKTEGIGLSVWCADLTKSELPAGAFELVVVTRYLQRSLFESIRRAVVPGGFVIYETFTTAQPALGWGPKSPDHLLDPGELRRRFEMFEIESYEEVDAPEAVARLVARRRR